MIVRARRVNYARRQQYRRLSRASEAGIGAAGTALLGLWAASVGAVLVAVCLLVLAAALSLFARHWLSLARRSRVGARSEDEVQRALAPLQAEGWRCGIRCGGRAGGTLTRWRSRRRASLSRL